MLITTLQRNSFYNSHSTHDTCILEREGKKKKQTKLSTYNKQHKTFIISKKNISQGYAKDSINYYLSEKIKRFINIKLQLAVIIAGRPWLKKGIHDQWTDKWRKRRWSTQGDHWFYSFLNLLHCFSVAIDLVPKFLWYHGSHQFTCFSSNRIKLFSFSLLLINWKHIWKWRWFRFMSYRLILRPGRSVWAFP